MATRLIAMLFAAALFGCEDRGACEGVPTSDGLTQEMCQEIKLRMMGIDPATARKFVGAKPQPLPTPQQKKVTNKEKGV